MMCAFFFLLVHVVPSALSSLRHDLRLESNIISSPDSIMARSHFSLQDKYFFFTQDLTSNNYIAIWGTDGREDRSFNTFVQTSVNDLFNIH